jgi:MFS family permease
MKRGFFTIMSAQFFSSLADNMLFIAAVQTLLTLEGPEWLTPLLKWCFTLSYVVLAAFVGAFADSRPKGKVMFATNTLKIFGCAMIFLSAGVTIPGMQSYWLVLLAYAIVGLGAAAYSPAKYGILTELLPPEQLVLANGWIEGLTVGSIVLGNLLGGVLISPEVSTRLLKFDFPYIDTPVDTAPEAAIVVIGLTYVIAAAFNLAIPDTGARYPQQQRNPMRLLADFSHCFHTLWKDKLGQISLAVTTLFWGAGATLQVLTLRLGREAAPPAPGPRVDPARRIGHRHHAGGGAGRSRAAQEGAQRPSGGHRHGAGRHDPGVGEVDAGRLLRAHAVGRDGGLLRGADERAAAAPRPRAVDGRPLDRGAELQREREHPAHARHLRADDPHALADQRHHRDLRRIRRRGHADDLQVERGQPPGRPHLDQHIGEAKH